MKQVLPDPNNMLAMMAMSRNGGYGPGYGGYGGGFNPLSGPPAAPPATYGGGGNPLTFATNTGPGAPAGPSPDGVAQLPAGDFADGRAAPSGMPMPTPETRFTPVKIGGHEIGMTGNLTSGEEIRDIVGASVQSVLGPGSRVEISSGHRPGDHNSQHGGGHAIDFAVYRSDGSRLDWDDPDLKEIMRVAAQNDVLGFGAGPTYMGGSTFHFDTGKGAPNGFVRPGIMTWSDSGSGAANHGPGAAHWRNMLLEAANM
jgi:hypothetical protein